MTLCRAQGFTPVSTLDRTDLLNYLTGVTATSAYIVAADSADAGAASVPSAEKRLAESDAGGAKKARIEYALCWRSV